MRQAIRYFEAVVFLLGEEYLLSTHPPLVPAPKQRFVFLTSKQEAWNEVLTDPTAETFLRLVGAGRGHA